MRRISRTLLRYWGWERLAPEAELLVSELVTNALKHGSGPRVTFTMMLTGQVVRIEVDDASPGRPVCRRAGPEAEDGRGLLLVASIADAWGTCGRRTWCELRLPDVPVKEAA